MPVAHGSHSNTHDEGNPEEAAETRQAREKLRAILDEMEIERRAVFVMFEVDEMTCDEIASAIGAPVGTVWSRLHAARKEFAKILARHNAREARGGAR
jgi:RNA polymerase sigma-70 factor (ECF subfamily)